MDEHLETLGDEKHVLREAQIKLLKMSQYLGGVVDIIERLIEKEGEK